MLFIFEVSRVLVLKECSVVKVILFGLSGAATEILGMISVKKLPLPPASEIPKKKISVSDGTHTGILVSSHVARSNPDSKLRHCRLEGESNCKPLINIVSCFDHLYSCVLSHFMAQLSLLL